MKVGKRHILGPKSYVSIASSVERILAVAMEIWNHECGPFWPNFAVFAIVCHIEAVPRTPWLGYGIQPVSGPLTPCTEGKTPVDAPFRAVKPRIGNRCTASGDLYIRISGINGVLFSYCFRQSLCFRSDIHCFDCWRLDRDFTVTASLTVYNGNFNAIRHEGSKAFRNCMDASAIFTSYTRNHNPNFSGCRNLIFDFDIPALDLTSFEWTYVLPYARMNFPFILRSI